jgi:hypothetical protein
MIQRFAISEVALADGDDQERDCRANFNVLNRQERIRGSAAPGRYIFEGADRGSQDGNQKSGPFHLGPILRVAPRLAKSTKLHLGRFCTSLRAALNPTNCTLDDFARRSAPR